MTKTRVRLALVITGLATVIATGSLLVLAFDEPSPPDDDPSVVRGERTSSPSPSPSSKPFHFVNVTEEVGLALPTSPSFGSLWADHDGDGWPDLLVNRHKRYARLFINGEGLFSLDERTPFITPAPGRQIYDRHDCGWGEANGDGRLDLVCVSGSEKGLGEGPNRLYLQDPSGRLIERGKRFGMQDLPGRGRSLNWLDFDGDGDLDLFVGNELREGAPNVMFRNDGDGFSRVAVGLEDELATLSSAWSDWDNDGDPDLLVVGHGVLGTQAYENVDGSFENVALEGVTGLAWTSATWGDYDGDGWTDLFVIGEGGASIFKNHRGELRLVESFETTGGRMGTWFDAENDGDLDLAVVQGAREPYVEGSLNHPDLLLVQDEGKFSVVTRPWLDGPRTGDGDSVSVADYNRDGKLDLYVTNGNWESKGKSYLLENRGVTGNWAGVTLHGTDQNPWGYGARISFRAGGRTVHRELTDAISFRTQSSPGYVHVGLGPETSAIVKVRWPDGTRDCMKVAAGSITVLSIGTTEASCGAGPGAGE
jgi:hypothetical protein